MTEDVSLLDLARERMQEKGQKCSVHLLLQRHPNAQELLDNAGPAKSVHFSTAAEIITERLEFKMDGQTLSRHVNKKCGCRR